MPRAYATVFACLLLGAGVLVVAPWHAVDPDTLANLAIGRFIVQHGNVPAVDPFTFTDPLRPYSNPEWLGDVLWYGVYRVAGEAGLVAFKFLLVGVAWILAHGLSSRGSLATRMGSLVMLLALLPACASRFVERNELHSFWLIPLYALVLARTRREERWAGILLALGVLWANLHSSFVLGWLLVGAAFFDRLLAPDGGKREKGILLAVLLLHPLLGLASPLGVHNFDQLIDHARGTAVYSAMVSEWMPSELGAGRAAQLAMLVFQVVSLLSFLPAANRRKLGGLILVGSAVVLAQRAPRFFPLAALLSVPTVSANLAAWLDQPSARARRVKILASLATVLLVLVPAAIEGLEKQPRLAIFDHSTAQDRLARFLAQNAPPRSRLLNTYNPGPWLLWHAAPHVRIAIDPRNNLGAEILRRYKNQVWVDRGAFQQELQRFDIGLAMLDLYGDQRSGPSRFLDQAQDWRLVYLDGRYALFARDNEANRALIQAHGYRRLRARLGFEYLLGPPGEQRREDEETLGADLAHLREQGPSLAGALTAYAQLCRDGNPPPRLRDTPSNGAAEPAARLLQEAMAHLPPSAHLFTYLATAYGRMGNTAGSAQVLAAASHVFPGSVMLLALEHEMARQQGHMKEAQALAANSQGHLLAEPELMPLLSNQPLTLLGWPESGGP